MRRSGGWRKNNDGGNGGGGNGNCGGGNNDDDDDNHGSGVKNQFVYNMAKKGDKNDKRNIDPSSLNDWNYDMKGKMTSI